MATEQFSDCLLTGLLAPSAPTLRVCTARDTLSSGSCQYFCLLISPQQQLLPRVSAGALLVLVPWWVSSSGFGSVHHTAAPMPGQLHWPRGCMDSHALYLPSLHQHSSSPPQRAELTWPLSWDSSGHLNSACPKDAHHLSSQRSSPASPHSVLLLPHYQPRCKSWVTWDRLLLSTPCPIHHREPSILLPEHVHGPPAPDLP